MVRPLRAASGALLLLLSAVAARDASAAGGVAKWTEWHPTGDDARLILDGNGVARIEHAVRYRVVMGPLKQIELTGLEKNATIGPDATVTGDDGREMLAHVEAKGEGALRLIVDEPKGLKR